MILIDALYINKGGGKILLKYLLDNMPINNNLFFLIDKRLENEYKHLDRQIFFLKGSLIKRHLFYKKFKNKFYFVFAFANLPPTIKLSCRVVTFFQNVLLIDNSFLSFALEIKKLVFKMLVPNTTSWIVQSSYIRELLQKKIGKTNIDVLPFFDEPAIIKDFSKRIISSASDVRFIYISSGEYHKNHELLFKAFASVSKINPQYTLTVTLGPEYTFLLNIIKELNDDGVNIINIGNVSHEQLYLEYLNADICIYPSLKESFGLGLIEAAQFGLPIFAADLPYVKEVVRPSCFFDPFDEKSMVSVMLNCKSYSKNSVSIITNNNFNKIVDLIFD